MLNWNQRRFEVMWPSLETGRHQGSNCNRHHEPVGEAESKRHSVKQTADSGSQAQSRHAQQSEPPPIRVVQIGDPKCLRSETKR
jgi:hypothetical protein